MKYLEKYQDFNLDLRRMLKAGMQRRGYDLVSLADAVGFEIEHVCQILEWPIRVPGCDFGVVVEHLGLINEFYEVYLRELGRSIARDHDRPTLH